MSIGAPVFPEKSRGVRTPGKRQGLEDQEYRTRKLRGIPARSLNVHIDFHIFYPRNYYVPVPRL
jgi:hypothetical protein